MPATDDYDSLTLPEGSRLFYIGPPKTGTTSLQEAARAARKTLSEHGVFYPGTGRNHRAAVHALMRGPEPIIDLVGGKPMPPGIRRADAGRVPPMDEWHRVMAAIDGQPEKRVLLTHEYAAHSSDEQAARFVDELGRDRIHVAITLRPLSRILASRWAESLREGETVTFERWLEAFYDPSDDLIPAATRRYLDQAGLVERWVRAAGADRVTVIMVDKDRRDLLPEAFERLLGVPSGTLTGIVDDGFRENRSMSRPEAQVIQRVNAAVLSAEGASWPAYLTVVRRGAGVQLMRKRTPGPSEARVRLPQWAFERAEADGQEFARRIRATGVRLVGDLDQLHGAASTADDGDGPDDPESFCDVAVTSLIGAVRATTAYEKSLADRIDGARKEGAKAEQLLVQEKAHREKAGKLLAQERSEHEKTRANMTRLQNRTVRDQVKRLPAQQKQRKAAESFTTRDLAGALLIRLRHKARTRRPMPLT